MKPPQSVASFFVAAVLLVPPVRAAAPTESAHQLARRIAALANFHGGLIVHLGCGDGSLSAALRLTPNCVVHGLDADADNVASAQRRLHSLGLYGSVAVMHWQRPRLPYADNLATVVVWEDTRNFTSNEVWRVLRPWGTVVIKQGENWVTMTKPKPPDIDEWPQHFHSADNNAVAHDAVVGPPRRFQWIAEPQWQRSHLSMPSINSMISAGGRLFTIEDTASAEHPALPGKFALVARDAYNGIVLWRVAFPDWHPIYIRDKETPVQLQRRLATSGQLVYCTPGYFAPITAFDAVTGQPRKTYNGTERTVEFVLDQNTLFVVTGDQSDVSAALMDQARTALKTSLFPLAAYGPRILRAENPKNDILAVDVATGKELWRKTGDDTLGYQGASLAVKNNCIVYATNRDLVCLERATGRLLWRRVAPVVLKGPHGIAVSLVLSEHAAFLADSQSLRAFRLADGSALWSRPIALNHHKPPDVFLANGLVWTASYDASIGRPVPERGLDKLGINGFDPDTGKLLKHIPQTMSGPMGHDRCYRNRITTRFYINSVTGGSDFLEFATSAEFPNPWVRSTCGIGPLPCNGLYYVGPPACACCNSVMLNGLNALAPDPTLRTSGQIPVVEELHHLEKGPAFGATAYPAKSATTEDWPTYRHDPERTGTTKATVPATLTKSWEAKIGRRASAPVIAAGMVYIADVDGHTVYALALKDGKPHWQFTADGRVDSPPTYHDGLLLFGTRSGSVYCLRATDGALLWRFVPLAQRFICAYEQLESAWPICGSILVKNNRAYFAAGRNSFLDGGIFVYAVDPLTGKLLCRHRIYGPYGENGFPIENRHVVGGTSIEGCKGDIFLAAGDKLFLRHQGFNEDLSPIRLQDVKQPHLITSHGFLEAIPHHRSFWTIDTALRYDIPTGLGGIHGDILVTDGNRFFEVRGYQPGRAVAFDPREAGYTLFAGTCAGTATVEQPVRPKRKAKRAAVTPTPRSTKLWSISIPTTGKALVLAGDTLFVAGTPVVFPEDDLAKAYEGRMGGVLWVGSAATGTKLAEYKLDAPPAWDGMAAAHGKLFVTLADGRLLCMEPR